jgi:hypothetical protein
MQWIGDETGTAGYDSNDSIIAMCYFHVPYPGGILKEMIFNSMGSCIGRGSPTSRSIKIAIYNETTTIFDDWEIYDEENSFPPSLADPHRIPPGVYHKKLDTSDVTNMAVSLNPNIGYCLVLKVTMDTGTGSSYLNRLTGVVTLLIERSGVDVGVV